MRFNISSFLPAVLFASTVAASGASISASLDVITSKALALNTTVASWNGDFFGVLPILSASQALTDAINNGTAVAKASEPLSQEEAFSIVEPANTLVDDTKSVLNTLVAAKSKFDALVIGSPIVLQILKTDRADAKNLTTAVTEKVPVELQSVAESITAPIDVAFADAIEKYSSAGF
ncbi:hydrophobic surface binding protein A-domain-containing protein [Rhexocercosporidium sp. MPI-PUGE-AT-0058]|nr:hydrophobic surface binding protein A-domain-containing protein [Rhexocercosporidium sp. MPI-PUGE-AT-0058]